MAARRKSRSNAQRPRRRTRVVTQTRRVYVKAKRGTRRAAGTMAKAKSIFRTGLGGDIVGGIGGGFVGTMIAQRVAPQWTMPAALAGGFLGGGVPGALAALIIQGGGLKMITQYIPALGGGSNAGAGDAI